MSVVLGARGLSAGYAGVPVVREIDLEVRRGEVVALLGPNGAGKTTTLLALAGEVPVLGGEVHLGGAATSAPLHRRAAAGLGLITQERSVFMSLSVRDNLRLGRGDPDRAVELFPELEPHLDRRAGLLSGGQQQILTTARALAAEPEVLLADELSLGLAPQIVARLLSAIRDAAGRGVAVLLVEQQLSQALKVADRAYVLRRGRIELTDDAAALRERIGEVTELYLSAAK